MMLSEHPAEIARNDGDGFERLHPASLLFGIGRHGKALLLPAIIVLFFTHKGSWEYWVAILFVPSALYELYHFATLRYRITGDEMIIKQGLIFRNERHIPLARVQNIDVTQNPLHRILKVAEVRLETAGGATPEAVFRVLALPSIERMRTRVFAERDVSALITTKTVEGDSPAQDAVSQSDQRQTLLSIPTRELIKLGLISNRGMALVLVAWGLAWQYDMFDRLDIDLESLFRRGASNLSLVTGVLLAMAFVMAALALLRLLSAAWMVLRFHDFRLTRDGDDFRLTCGLLTRITATVPRQRIQLVSVRQTVLQRWLKRASIRIETAGGSTHDQGGGEGHATLSRRWFVPIIDAQALPEVLRQIRAGMDLDFASAEWQPLAPRARTRMLRLALIIALLITLLAALIVRPWGAGIGLVIVPLALWHAHREAAFTAYAKTAGGMMYRSGAFTRCVSATFFDKVQTISLRESPFDRRYRMATFCIDTAGAGPADHRVRVPYLQKDVVLALLADVHNRTERATFTW